MHGENMGQPVTASAWLKHGKIGSISECIALGKGALYLFDCMRPFRFLNKNNSYFLHLDHRCNYNSVGASPLGGKNEVYFIVISYYC
jgi:hypothetical protein